jgi:hypothetical protein
MENFICSVLFCSNTDGGSNWNPDGPQTGDINPDNRGLLVRDDESNPLGFTNRWGLLVHDDEGDTPGFTNRQGLLMRDDEGRQRPHMAPLLDHDMADWRPPAPTEPAPREEARPCRLDLDEAHGESMNDEGKHTRW